MLFCIDGEPSPAAVREGKSLLLSSSNDGAAMVDWLDRICLVDSSVEILRGMMMKKSEMNALTRWGYSNKPLGAVDENDAQSTQQSA